MDPRLKLKNKGDGYHPQLRLEENQLILQAYIDYVI